MTKITLFIASIAIMWGCTCKKQASKKQPDKPAVVIVDPDELTRPTPVAEKEPNNDRRRAQSMPTDQWIAGTIHAAKSEKKDVDWYRVQVTTEGHLLKATLAGVPDLDLSLEAYDHNGQRLVKVNNSREGGGEILINLSVSPGDYYLKIRDVKNQMSAASYRIKFQLQPKEQGDEIEPNWKSELATPLALEEEAIGYLGWHKDLDWYQVDLKDLMAGDRLKVEFDGVDNVRANLSLRTKKGVVLQQRWAGAGQSLVLPNIALPQGTSPLFIVVRCGQASNVEAKYSLRIFATVGSETSEREPNDTIESATLLKPAIATDGLLADTKDYDFYRIMVHSPSVFRIITTAPMGLDIALAYIDANGKVLWEIDQGKAREMEIMPAVAVTPPSAFFRLRAPRRRYVNATSPYHIKAVRLDEPYWEKEPNASWESATWIKDHKLVLKAYSYPENDVDVYKFVANREMFSCRIINSLKLKLKPALFDIQKKPVTLRNHGEELFKAMVKPGEHYYLKIKGVKNGFSATLPYQLQRDSQ